MTHPPEQPRRHILTVALEDYFQVGAFNRFVQRNQWYRFESRLERNTDRALALLARHDAKATFFALGWVAARFPELLRKVADAGHEVAVKGYYHRGIRDMTPEEFTADARRAKDAAEAATGRPVRGYRLADGWLGPQDLWSLDCLAASGFEYDSSVAPMRRAFADQPFRAAVHRHAPGLWEVPVSSAKVLGVRVPVAGGNYLRQLPEALTRRACATWVRKHGAPLVAYFHAWELDPDQPRLSIGGPLARPRHDRNLHRMEDRLGRLLAAYRFTSAADYLGLSTDSDVSFDAPRPRSEHDSERIVVSLAHAPSVDRVKFRLGLTIFRASKIRDWKALERIPVVDWLTRWSGRRTVEKIWLPLLRSKLGDSYKVASAAFIWAIIARMYAARRSGLKKEMFGYVRGGYARVLGRFTEALTADGVELRTGAKVEAIESAGGGVRVALAGGKGLHFDRVVCTAAPPLASRMVPDLTADEHARLNAVRYQGIVCASVLLNQPLARYYVTNITDDWVPFTAVVEMSALADRAEFGGNCLVYLPKYVSPDDPIFDESDDAIRARFLAALTRMYPQFRYDDVLGFRVSRVRHVFAVSTLNYSASVPPVATSVPGVYLVNSAQIVNGTLNVNETLQLAESAMPALLASREAAVLS